MKKEFRTKIVSILLTLAMVSLVVVPLGMVAASADGYAYEPDTWEEKQISLSSATAEPGEDVVLVLSASDFTATTALTLTLTFDPDVLSIAGAEEGVLTLNKNVSNGVVAELTFTVASSAEAGTAIAVAVACSDAGVDTVDGCIRVTAPAVPPVDAGDVDANGDINTVDLSLLAQYIANFNPETGLSSVSVNMIGADVNGDGTINTVDLSALAQYLASH